MEWGPREKDVVLLGEYVRMALGRQICFRVADRNRLIAAYMMERGVEDDAARRGAADHGGNLSEHLRGSGAAGRSSSSVS